MPGIKRAHEDRSVLLERRHYQERPVVLEVQDPGNFRVRFKIVKDGGIDSDVGEAQHRCILMGIIPRRACSDAFAVEDDHPKHGYFITDFGNLWAQDGTDMESEIHNLPIDISLTLHFISEPTPTLIASTDDQLPCVLHFERPIPPDDYRPCVVFRTEDTAVEATVVETTKRPVVRGSPGGILAKMWEARSFADAELACDGKAFPAHREVLAAASPASSRIDVGDSTPKAVEALLRCIYTGNLDAGDAPAVLPLAHRYQMECIVRRSGELMLQGLSPETAARTASTFRSFREDKAVAPLWDSLVGRCLVDEALLRATLEGL